MTAYLAKIPRWESLLALAILVIVVNGSATPGFLATANIAAAFTAATPVALIALAMTLVIVAGDIDLSVGGIVSLSNCVFGWAIQSGWSLAPAVALALATSMAAGALNGVVIVRLGLPSLVVTLGTMTLFSGMSYIVLGGGHVSTFPAPLLSYANGLVGTTVISWPVLTFLVLLVGFAITLQWTRFGRHTYAVGVNATAARFSGVPVDRTRFLLFLTSGAMSGLAALVLTGYLSSAKPDLASGLELNAIAIVLLGGVSIFGGVGRVTSVFVGLVLYVLLTNLLSLRNISADSQQIVVGGMLIASVLISNVAPRVASAVRRSVGQRLRRSRNPVTV